MDQLNVIIPEERENFGTWMLVKKPVRKHNPKQANQTTGANTTTSGGTREVDKAAVQGAQIGRNTDKVTHNIQGEKSANGSRFAILKG